MSANPNVQNPAVNKGDNQPQVGNTNSDSLGMMSVGPAALAQLIIYQIMAMYSEIIHLDQKQKVNSLESQKEEAFGQAAATKSAGQASGGSMIAAGVCTIAGSVASALTIGLGLKSSTKDLEVEQNGIDERITPLDKIEEFSSTEEANSGGYEAGDLDLDDDGTNEVSLVAREMKEGDYSQALEPVNADKPNGPKQLTDDAKEAIKQMKAASKMKKDELPEDSDWSDFDFDDDFKLSNRKELNRLSTERNTLAQKLMTSSTKYQMYGQGLSGICNGASQFSQGIGQMEKAKYDAAASLNGTASQQAGSTANDFGQGMSKAYEAQNAEVQILEKIHQTNSVRG